MNRLVLVPVLLIFAGCANPYYHPTKSIAEFNGDYSNCQFEAELATADMSDPQYAYQKSARETELINRCLAQKGWTPQGD